MTDKSSPNKSNSAEDADYEDEGAAPARRAPRWLASSVMLVATVGFVGLAYYAYHAGTRSIHEEELMLVEADSTPAKEKPTDPGGMKFPHQDKSIFDAISSNNGKVAAVERVLPAPEEPMNKDQAAAVAANSSNWVNDKLSDSNPNAAEALIETKPGEAKSLSVENKLAEAAGKLAPSAGTEEKEQVVVSSTLSEVSVNEAKGVDEAPKHETPAKVELKRPESVKAAKKESISAKIIRPEAKAVKVASGKGFAQLGAYRSEAEAKGAWTKIRAKHAELASLKTDIQQADLGEKGTFYRLRVSVADAKTLCQTLTRQGQPCIAAK